VAKNCFDALRWGIQQIADPEYQTRVWLGDAPDEFSSFLDATAEIIDQDERMRLIASHLTEIGLTEQQWSHLIEFSRALKDFEDSVAHPYDDSEVVKHPNWNLIVNQARALLAELPKPD
jgi:hypothetical protein